MDMDVHSIPGKLEVTWRDDVKAIVDTWTNYHVTLDEFRDAVLGKGLGFGRRWGVRAWIVDSTHATGAFPQEVQDFIGSDVFPTFKKEGVEYFVTVLPKSALTKMTVKRFSEKTGPAGLKLVEVHSLEDAVSFLMQRQAA